MLVDAIKMIAQIELNLIKAQPPRGGQNCQIEKDQEFHIAGQKNTIFFDESMPIVCPNKRLCPLKLILNHSKYSKMNS